nr:MAG TPA: hypothetical protein [Caudoviricetes sp.]
MTVSIRLRISGICHRLILNNLMLSGLKKWLYSRIVLQMRLIHKGNKNGISKYQRV